MGLPCCPKPHLLPARWHAFLDTVPCLDWNKEAANRYAPLRAQQKISGNPIGYMDTQIAAHALAENLILVTNNERHYGRIDGLQLLNWAVAQV